MVNLVHSASFWFICVHFGSFWLIWFILVHFANWINATLVHFGSFSLIWVILVHLVHFGSFWFIWFILVHFANWINAIFENFTIQKTRKYSTGNKISFVLQNLFKSDREKD